MLSRGFASLTPGAYAVGRRVAAGAAGALQSLLGRAVSIRARPTPGAAVPRAAVATVALDLTALPAQAVLEVDPSVVVALVEALAGGADVPGDADVSSRAAALTPIEAAALELFVLAALEGACSVREVEGALAPRLSRSAREPASPLSIELELSAGNANGRGRLLVPFPAVRALQDGEEPAGPGLAVRIPLSVRSGAAPLLREEVAALGPGDVVLLDGPPGTPDALVAPGGARLAGRLGDGAFHFEEVTMTTRTSELPVVLEVELARVEVAVAELARLEPGAALPLAIDRRGIVTLRVGERVIGRGELVDVDGAVGVRVLTLEVPP
jgi:type III secretion protein Q